MKSGLRLHIVHVADTRMIDQGTNGLSRGVLVEGVLAGKAMLNYVDIAKTAFERHPPLLEFVRSWMDSGSSLCPLEPIDWFEKAHGIESFEQDTHGVWIPDHVKAGNVFLWAPPPVIADVAMEEC